MEERIVFSIFTLIIFVLWMGLLSIIKPEFMVKTTALNTLKKTPTKSQIRRYKLSGYFWLVAGIVLIIIIMFGGFEKIG